MTLGVRLGKRPALVAALALGILNLAYPPKWGSDVRRTFHQSITDKVSANAQLWPHRSNVQAKVSLRSQLLPPNRKSTVGATSIFSRVELIGQKKMTTAT